VDVCCGYIGEYCLDNQCIFSQTVVIYRELAGAFAKPPGSEGPKSKGFVVRLSCDTLVNGVITCCVLRYWAYIFVARR
jgi:hypothetical protein